MTAYTLPYALDPLEFAAKKILTDFQSSLPDLGNCIVLLPNYQVASAMRRHILRQAGQQGFQNLLGPKVFLFRDFILKNTLINALQLDTVAAELLVIQSISENKLLFGDHNTLSSSYALLDLINDLTRNQVILPSNFFSFKQQLLKAYAIKSNEFDALSKEAQLVFSIWRAWHDQLQQLGKTDKESLYQLKLGQNHAQHPSLYFYLLGSQTYSPSEIRWMQQKLQNQKLTIITHAETSQLKSHPDALSNTMLQQLNLTPDFIKSEQARNTFLSIIFSNEKKLLDRIKQAKQRFPLNPISQQLRVFKTISFEDEANGIQIQIRRWLQQGIKDIAFIAEDRRLARRVRALLERHGISLQDNEGWALSTSSAASVIENILESVEENFSHIPLLNLFRSELIFPQNTQTMAASYKLETELVHYEKIYNDISRYKAAAESRQVRLGLSEPETNTQLFEMLNRIQQATQDLRDLHTSNRCSVKRFIESLVICLKNFGSWEKLLIDNAGQIILKLFDTILILPNDQDVLLSWTEARQWLAKKLEETTFTTESMYTNQVKFLHLHQSNLSRHEAIIIGGATRDTLPGTAKKMPFFNQQVYRELGLTKPHAELNEKFHYFRRLLEAADKVYVSYHSGEEDAQASPWLELLCNFCRLAYTDDLRDPLLETLVNRGKSSQQNTFVKQTSTVKIESQQMPIKISASAHQTLIDCPYAYFIAEVIKLRAPEEVRQTLAKSDYGERVHFILYLFHQGDRSNYPTAFPEKLTQANREKAVQYLQEISHAVFKADLEDNFQHRGWYKRWLSIIPYYIDWQIEEQASWTYYKGEISSSRQLSNGIQVYGRIDRVDSHGQYHRIIDYKTGNHPNKSNIESGESVQLTHYAISSDKPVKELAYLPLDNRDKALVTSTMLNEENLTHIQQEAENRLVKMLNDIKQGEKMSAWGDDKTCDYCQFAGLCREKLD